MRPVTLFTGQWADLPFETICKKAVEFNYDGIEIACWGDHFEVHKADAGYCRKKKEILQKHDLKLFVLSTHLLSQAVSDPIDQRHKNILPDHIWGNGKPEEVRKRASEEMMKTAWAAKEMEVKTVVGFTGSPIWHMMYAFPPVSQDMIESGYQKFATQWIPILDEFRKAGVSYALEVHPTEIAFDIVTAERTLTVLNNHPSFGFNFDPSHLGYQGVDYIKFIHRFASQILHVHIKDAYWSELACDSGVFGGHLPFGDVRRSWDFRSPGRGNVNFEEIIRALNHINYTGPLSVEWEDAGMDREHGALEACEFVRQFDFKPSMAAFDAAFGK